MRKLDFWNQLKERVIEKGIINQTRKVYPSGFGTSLGIHGIQLKTSLREKKKQSEVRLMIRAKYHVELYSWLLEKQDEIETHFGQPMIWKSKPDAKRSYIAIARDDVSYWDEDGRDSLMKWFEKQLSEFKSYFTRVVSDFSLSDGEFTEENGDELDD